MKPTWHLSVDPSRCGGTANCVDIAPGLFRLTDDAIAQPLVSALTDELYELAAEAADNCPTGAIIIVRQDPCGSATAEEADHGATH